MSFKDSMKSVRFPSTWKSFGADRDDKISYATLVPSADSEDFGDVLLSTKKSHSHGSPFHHILAVGWKTLLVLLAIIGLVTVWPFSAAAWRYIHSPSGRFEPSLYPSCSCGGSTVAEAKARGCIFTPIAIAWLPPHCVDMELSDEFDKLGPGPNGEWDYWSDKNMTRRLTREEVGELADYDGVFWTTQEWHVTHCVYTWKKHYRSQWTGVTIERRSNGLDHIDHCSGVFRMRAPLQAIATVAGIELDADDPGETNFDDF